MNKVLYLPFSSKFIVRVKRPEGTIVPCIVVSKSRVVPCVLLVCRRGEMEKQVTCELNMDEWKEETDRAEVRGPREQQAPKQVMLGTQQPWQLERGWWSSRCLSCCANEYDLCPAAIECWELAKVYLSRNVIWSMSFYRKITGLWRVHTIRKRQ